jgi:hypothetical protein
VTGSEFTSKGAALQEGVIVVPWLGITELQACFVVITENTEILRFVRNYEKNHYEKAKSL